MKAFTYERVNTPAEAALSRSARTRRKIYRGRDQSAGPDEAGN
ncbi:Uncharacterised protein [Escherichia coli]|uniref:Uncharacterized protein n=1 Tax=Escherichia coli TaxID=562 RepID=A0A376L010_ECOLX|nr:Uncharacterised protein [Escherichia coli]